MQIKLSNYVNKIKVIKTKKSVLCLFSTSIIFFIFLCFTFFAPISIIDSDRFRVVLTVIILLSFTLGFIILLLLISDWDEKRREKKEKVRNLKISYWIRRRKFNDSKSTWEILNYYNLTSNTKEGCKFSDLRINCLSELDSDRILVCKDVILRKIKSNREYEEKKFNLFKNMLEMKYEKNGDFSYILTAIITIVSYPIANKLFLELTGFKSFFDKFVTLNFIPSLMRFITLYIIIIIFLFILVKLLKIQDLTQKKNIIFLFELVEKDLKKK